MMRSSRDSFSVLIFHVKKRELVAFKCFVMWRFVFGWVLFDVSNDPSAFMLIVDESKTWTV